MSLVACECTAGSCTVTLEQCLDEGAELPILETNSQLSIFGSSVSGVSI